MHLAESLGCFEPLTTWPP